MSTHDPRQVIENMRNHLATHDRHLAFLFGAGTSSAVNIAPNPAVGEKPRHVPLIPGIEGLTEVCGKAVCSIGETEAAAWVTLVKQCEKEGCSANVENMLSKVRMKIDAIGEGETLLGLSLGKLCGLESAICTSIAKSVNLPETIIPERIPHDDFAVWVKRVNRTAPMEIFTTNYDILFERAFEAARVPVFDGFAGTYHPFFYPESLDDDGLLPNPKWIRLWKLHGSVNWLLESTNVCKRIVRGQPCDTGELILPSQRKYDESRKQPYVAYMDRLSRVLNSEHALLITCGYGFGDEHINAILYGALDNRNTTNIVVLRFEDLNEKDSLVSAALRRSNLTVIGPNAAVISGVCGSWQLTQPVDSKTYAFMDTGFDSNALPEDEGSAAAVSGDLKGRMRLGDFNWFCRFLNAMVPDGQ
jgi:hypothetical protein